MKVHVVTKANRALYTSQLERMHQLRHRVFVEELGWSDLNSDDGLEIDDFDGDDAVYLLACEDGECFGSVRMLPTWRRSMIKEVWPHFVTNDELAFGPDIWEWTRWCPGLLTRRHELVRARKALFLGALEYAGSRNIKTYITFCETRYFGQLEEIGWRPRPLGLPQATQGDAVPALGVIWDITEELLESTRELFRMHGPILVEASCPGSSGAFVQPWMVERLYSLSCAEDALHLEEALLGVGHGQGRQGATLDARAVAGRA